MLGKEQASQDSASLFLSEALREILRQNLPSNSTKSLVKKVPPREGDATGKLKEGTLGKDWTLCCYSKLCPKSLNKARHRSTGGSHATVVAETQKVATKVLALKKHKSLPRNIATRETTREEWKQCQKVKEVQEGTGSQSQRSKSQVLRMTYPNHGYVKKHILSLLGSVTSTSQEL
ncbi:hypothetical protein Tco_1539542 [Tanacetum coccineum]